MRVMGLPAKLYRVLATNALASSRYQDTNRKSASTMGAWSVLSLPQATSCKTTATRRRQAQDHHYHGCSARHGSALASQLTLDALQILLVSTKAAVLPFCWHPAALHCSTLRHGHRQPPSIRPG